MGLLIPNFQSTIGLTLPQAYLQPNYCNYDTQNHCVSFDVSIWASKEAYLNGYKPIESGINYATLPLDYDGTQNILAIIDNGIIIKANEVEGKTQEECDIHNAAIDVSDIGVSWLNYWDISYQRFLNAVSDIPTQNKPESLPGELGN